MHVEQRLEICRLCRRVLALQYHWYADRMPTWSRDRLMGRWLKCPACGYTNFFYTLMDANRFELKLVPGPEPFVPFPAHRHPDVVRGLAATPRPSKSSFFLEPLARAITLLWQRGVLIAWLLNGAM